MILLGVDSNRASSNKSSSSWRRFNSSSLARDQHLVGVALWSSPLRWFFFFVFNDCSSSFPSILLFQQFFTFSDVTVHQLKLKLTVLDVSQEWAGSCLGLVQLKSTPRFSQFSRLFFLFFLDYTKILTCSTGSNFSSELCREGSSCIFILQVACFASFFFFVEHF